MLQYVAVTDIQTNIGSTTLGGVGAAPETPWRGRSVASPTSLRLAKVSPDERPKSWLIAWAPRAIDEQCGGGAL
jgi:hypothetical protein